ncbi:MAG TPA: flavodoxin-dependent (E)-4-hydroxy-3-methylbut-2-enyl-diphosphate synthase [Papillibacter sp.]|nr:flavodoxin-dependent (E)-4-hydroxy-3-methylbut-2-enyl-diphosphate synthase [Papillibacter sp.]
MAKKSITVGALQMGGGAPVTIQSMTNTNTADVEATRAQIARLENAGCDIVRVAVPDTAAARAIAALKETAQIPIVADIHFDYRLALEAVAAGADKIRLNPGNIGTAERVRDVARACRERGVPIRIGVNGGSLEREILARHGGVTPEALVESALGHVRLLNQFDFDDICISAKASDVRLTVLAYRLLAERTDYPLHLGVTEAGTEYMGLVKSAAGIGALLIDGIGDTVRISLTAEPEREVRAALALLGALGLRKTGPEVISCPTCGRTQINLIGIANEVEKRLEGMKRPITVAVMGCAVNGPGEASRADYGIAGGRGEGVLFKGGKVLRKVPMEQLVDALIDLIERDER